jgi:hypothetical protein
MAVKMAQAVSSLVFAFNHPLIVPQMGLRQCVLGPKREDLTKISQIVIPGILISLLPRWNGAVGYAICLMQKANAYSRNSSGGTSTRTTCKRYDFPLPSEPRLLYSSRP